MDVARPRPGMLIDPPKFAKVAAVTRAKDQPKNNIKLDSAPHPQKKAPRYSKKSPAFYEVETVLQHRVTNKGDYEYMVKWVGYDTEANSWEPEKGLNSNALNIYWEHAVSRQDSAGG